MQNHDVRSESGLVDPVRAELGQSGSYLLMH